MTNADHPNILLQDFIPTFAAAVSRVRSERKVDTNVKNSALDIA